jgi:threonylcarbamoyladenosine tRNA methylthiotransferase MtaB
MGRTAIPLRVQTGCGEPCSFCIIPSTRGPSRSLPLLEILDAATRLAESGYREIWLVGVHLGAYGRDLPESSSLIQLARALDGVRGDVTFRLSSLEPMDCPAALVDLVASSGRFAPHFHLPLQHGSDRVLGLMRRPYTAAYFEALVSRIAERIPHVSIGSDVMAGFPGETDDDVRTMAELLEQMPLSYLHVFPYSDRPGTEAARMEPKVGGTEIRARAARLRIIGTRYAQRFAARQVGSVRPGLTIDDGTVVLTDNYLKVRIPPGLARNVRVRVRIDGSEPHLRGEVI